MEEICQFDSLFYLRVLILAEVGLAENELLVTRADTSGCRWGTYAQAMDALASGAHEGKFDPHEEFRACLSVLREVLLRVLLEAHEFVLLVEDGRSVICSCLFDEVVGVSELSHGFCDVTVEWQLIKLRDSYNIRIDLSHMLAEELPTIVPLEVLVLDILNVLGSRVLACHIPMHHSHFMTLPRGSLAIIGRPRAWCQAENFFWSVYIHPFSLDDLFGKEHAAHVLNSASTCATRRHLTHLERMFFSKNK